jgi:enoyl-CoA hydratase/carnithine racemase
MPATHPDRVVTTIDGPIAHVALNRADKLNALDLPMMRSLVDTARDLRRARGVPAVNHAGAGSIFYARQAIASVARQPARMIVNFLRPPWRSTNLYQEACWAWRRLPVPVLAVIRGHCFGGGLQLALGADFRFTTADCRFSILEAKWGLVPDMSGTVSLRELLPMDVAKRLAMTGEIFSGEQAHAYGLASGVDADPGKLADELIAAIIARSPDSVAATKRLLNTVRRGSIRAAFGRERRFQVAMFRSKNTTAARTAGMKGEIPNFGPRAFD